MASDAAVLSEPHRRASTGKAARAEPTRDRPFETEVRRSARQVRQLTHWATRQVLEPANGHLATTWTLLELWHVTATRLAGDDGGF